MVKYSILVYEDGHVPQVVVQPYRCDDMHEDDLVVVVVVACSSDFGQPHPRNGPPPLQ